MTEEERRKVIDKVRAAMGRLRVAAESVPAPRFDDRPAARPRPRPARLTGPHTATPWVRGGVRLSF